MITKIAPILIAWFMANFQPLQDIISFIWKYIPNKLKFIKTYLECFKCLSFWITLYMTLDIYTAILYSIIAYTYDRIINALPMYM